MAGFDTFRLLRNRLPDNGSSGGSSGPASTSALFVTSFGVSDGWTVDSTALTASPGATGNSPTVSRAGTGTAGLHQDEVLTAANRQDGRGFRHYRGAPHNDNGGGISLQWAGTNPEIWARYYIRYKAGMVWENGDNPSYTKDFVLGGNKVFCGHQGPGWGCNVNGGPTHSSTYAWFNLMGGSSVADGLWHCFEWHLDANNGIVELWIDDVQRVNVSTANFAAAGVTSFNAAFTGNQSSLVSSGYTDYDDFYITSTGRVGL